MQILKTAHLKQISGGMSIEISPVCINVYLSSSDDFVTMDAHGQKFTFFPGGGIVNGQRLSEDTSTYYGSDYKLEYIFLNDAGLGSAFWLTVLRPYI